LYRYTAVLLGASTVSGLFTDDVLRMMGEHNERPVIMPLSNPTSQAECTSQAAAHATQGRAIFSAGSPFESVTVDENTMHANQGNNFYVFPGLGLGTILVVGLYKLNSVDLSQTASKSAGGCFPPA
jgi:malic enzyme